MRMLVYHTGRQVLAGTIYHKGITGWQILTDLGYLAGFDQHISILQFALLLVGPYRCIFDQDILLLWLCFPAIAIEGIVYFTDVRAGLFLRSISRGYKSFCKDS